jgi:predicted NBD/HSP70 family sugar kinase
VEVGGSSTQTVVFSPGGRLILDGAHQPDDAALALAVPGIIDGTRVVAASNLGWFDVDPVAELGLDGPAVLVCNDAEAAALGEAALRTESDLVYVGLGTGVGGAIVRDLRIVASNRFGHAPAGGTRRCRCGQVGCVETIAGGWALPPRPTENDIGAAALAIARAVRTDPLATPDTVVLAGGIVRRHPAVVELVSTALPERLVVRSAAHPDAKSAAAWGLQALVAAADRAG